MKKIRSATQSTDSFQHPSRFKGQLNRLLVAMTLECMNGERFNGSLRVRSPQCLEGDSVQFDPARLGHRQIEKLLDGGGMTQRDTGWAKVEQVGGPCT